MSTPAGQIAADTTAEGPPAPPRVRVNKRRWTGRRITLAIVFGLGACWGGFEIWWRVTAEPAPVVDYAQRLVNLSSSHQPPVDSNGWDTLMEAIVAFDTGQITAREADIGRTIIRGGYDATADVDFNAMLDGELDLDQFPRECMALEQIEAEGAWTLLDHALASPRIVRPRFNGQSLLNVTIGEVSSFRSMAKARATAMRIAATRADLDAMVQALEHALALGNVCSRQTFIIDRLVGDAIFALAGSELRILLGEYDFDEPTCRRMLEALDRYAQRPPLSMNLEGERAIMLDLVQQCYTDDGHGDGRFKPNMAGMLSTIGGPGGGNSVVSNLTSVYMAGRRETTELANRLYDQITEASQLPRPERRARAEEWDHEVQTISPRFFLFKQLMPALARVLDTSDATDMQLAGTRQLLALEIQFARHGEWPDLLDDLDADLRTPPLVDPFTGAAFIYRRLQADEHGRPFLLYSLAEDGEDQSDRWTNDAPWKSRHYTGVANDEQDHLLNVTRVPVEGERN